MLNPGYLTACVSRHRSGGGGATPTLIAHAVSQQSSSFTQPAPTSPIDTTGSNFLVMAINAYDNASGSSSALSLVADGFSSAPVVFHVTGTAFAGSTLTLTGVFTGGGSNAFAGKQFALAGNSSHAANNGYWPCTASTAVSIDLTVPGGAIDASSSIYCAMSQNKWNLAFVHNSSGGVAVWFSAGATTGAGHYFVEDDRTISGAGDGSSFAVAAFSGVATAATFVGNASSADELSATTVQAPSYSPAEANNLIMTTVDGLAIKGPESVDSSFIITDAYNTGSSLYNPIGLAYIVAPSTSALAPTWTVGANGNRIRADIFEFKHA